jgi:hypothetical protein
VTKYLFGILKVLHGADDLTVERHVEIVKSLLSWIGPLGFGGCSTNLEFGTNHLFCSSKRGEVIVDIMVSTEVWNSIVNLVTETLLFVLVLSATS